MLGDISDVTLVSDITEASVFSYQNDSFSGFINHHFVINAVNYLKCYDNFKDFIFCECEYIYVENVGVINDIDFTFPILSCVDIDERFGDSLLINK